MATTFNVVSKGNQADAVAKQLSPGFPCRHIWFCTTIPQLNPSECKVHKVTNSDYVVSFKMPRNYQLAFRFLGLAGLMLIAQLSLNAQVVRPRTPPPTMTADKSRPDSDDQAPTALDYEMRAKREIKYAEKEHQENLTRAREASELGNALAAAFRQNQALGSADLKKLEKLEKITKKIRSDAGASDDDFELEEKPSDLAEAVNSVAKVSTSLSQKVLKTPRRVVSTSIIEESNVLLELIRIVRTYVAR